MNAPSPNSHFDTSSEAQRRRSKLQSGSRTKLAQRFFTDLYEIWEDQGHAALARAMFMDPVAVVGIVAKLMPQKLEISTPTDGMTDDRLAQMLELAERMAALKAGAGDDARPVVLNHEKPNELNGLIEGGGGPFGVMGVVHENIPHATPEPLLVFEPADPLRQIGPSDFRTIAIGEHHPETAENRQAEANFRPGAHQPPFNTHPDILPPPELTGNPGQFEIDPESLF